MGKLLKRPIVILFTGHVGSSWLNSLLGHHQSITQLGFEPIDDLVLENINAAPVFWGIIRGQAISQFPELVRSILLKNYESASEDAIYQGKKYREKLATPFIVFKTRLYMQEQTSLFFELLPRVNPTVIFLCRRNKIKNAISQFKRTQLNISHLEGFDEIEDKRKPVEVDPAYILQQAINFVKRELVAKSYFEQLRQFTTSACYELFYEDLLSIERRDRFLDDFLCELGLENNNMKSNYLKMTPDNIQGAVVNFTELSGLLNGTAFEPSLEHDDYNIVGEIYSRKLEFPGIHVGSTISKVKSMFGLSEDA